MPSVSGHLGGAEPIVKPTLIKSLLTVDVGDMVLITQQGVKKIWRQFYLSD